jgi:hypothetical protein
MKVASDAISDEHIDCLVSRGEIYLELEQEGADIDLAERAFIRMRSDVALRLSVIGYAKLSLASNALSVLNALPLCFDCSFVCRLRNRMRQSILNAAQL